MEDITKIDVDAFMKAHPEENFLSSADIDFIRVKIGKSHVGRRDWEQVQDRMAGHSLFVMRPAGTISFIRTVERYLVDGNRLVLFTNLTDCREYLNRILEQNGPGDWKIQIGDIKVEEALAFARQHDLFAAIDYCGESDPKVFLYSGADQRGTGSQSRWSPLPR